MAAYTTRELSELFDARIKELGALEKVNASERANDIFKASDIKQFGCYAKKFFYQLAGVDKAHVASWIPGVPLPAMFAAKRRMTVDITPETLSDFGYSYNISPDTFIRFAEAGLIFVNIRNYDPLDPKASETLEAYIASDKIGMLPRLFQRASKSIYFLAVIRDSLFNPLFANGQTLRSCFDKAGGLAEAAEKASKLKPFSELVRKSVFRNERPEIKSVRWHWAYAQSTKRFSQQIDPDILEAIDNKFDKLIDGAYADAAAEFLDLAMRLRYAHLLTSAPVSAAFGGVYNFLLDGEAEFLQAVRYGARLADYDLIQDRVLDTIRALQLGKLPADIKKEIPTRYRSTLASAGVQVYVRYNDTSYLKHYESPTHQDEIIDYVLEDDGLEASFVQLEEEIDSLLLEDYPTVRAVAHIASECGALAMAQGRRLKKLTKLHQGVELPTTNLISYPSNPIYEANPKITNLLIRSCRIKDNNPSIGGAQDVRRRTIWFPRLFRRPPH